MLYCILSSPLPRGGLISSAIRFIHMCNLWHQRIIRIRICKHRTNRQQHLRYGQGGRPLILENVETNASVAIDIRMIDSSREVHLWRFEWIISREMNRQEKHSVCVGTICRSHDRSLPMKKVVTNRSSGTR
jgi:hypothetical protein